MIILQTKFPPIPVVIANIIASVASITYYAHVTPSYPFITYYAHITPSYPK